MKTSDSRTIDHAMYWVRAGQKNGRKLQLNCTYGCSWMSSQPPKLNITIYDGDVNVSMDLPTDFTGDLDTLLCQKKAEEVNAEIEKLQKQLAKIDDVGCYDMKSANGSITETTTKELT